MGCGFAKCVLMNLKTSLKICFKSCFKSKSKTQQGLKDTHLHDNRHVSTRGFEILCPFTIDQIRRSSYNSQPSSTQSIIRASNNTPESKKHSNNIANISDKSSSGTNLMVQNMKHDNKSVQNLSNNGVRRIQTNINILPLSLSRLSGTNNILQESLSYHQVKSREYYRVIHMKNN